MFENFFAENCERCGNSLAKGHIMSMFSDEEICMECKEKEKNDPDYALACKIDIKDYYERLLQTATEEEDYPKCAFLKSKIDKLNDDIFN